MCNLYSITTNQAAIIALFRVSDQGDATISRELSPRELLTCRDVLFWTWAIT
jgi:hypothetical protein